MKFNESFSDIKDKVGLIEPYVEELTNNPTLPTTVKVQYHLEELSMMVHHSLEALWDIQAKLGMHPERYDERVPNPKPIPWEDEVVQVAEARVATLRKTQKGQATKLLKANHPDLHQKYLNEYSRGSEADSFEEMLKKPDPKIIWEFLDFLHVQLKRKVVGGVYKRLKEGYEERYGK